LAVDSARSLGRAGVLVGVASAAANVLGFVFLALLSRAYSPAQFGEVSALLGVGAIGAVPAVAVQLLIARQLAAAPSGADVVSGRAVLALGSVLFAAVLLATPVLRPVLHIHATASLLWVGLSLVPFTVGGGLQGHLLGAERFRVYALGLLLVSGARVLTGGVALGARTSISTTMAVLAVATLGAVLVLAALTRVGWWWRPGRTHGWSREVRPFGVILFGIGGFLVLSGLDLLLARHYLVSRSSGVYAVGNLFTKAGLWGPQFVAIVVFPRLSAGAGRGLLVRAVAAVVVLGGIGIGLVAALGPWIVTTVAGDAYAAAGGYAWLFAVLGILLALVHLLLLGSVAEHSGWASAAVWVAVAAEVVLVATIGSGSVRAVLVSATAVTGTLVAVALIRRLRAPGAAPAAALPAGADAA